MTTMIELLECVRERGFALVALRAGHSAEDRGRGRNSIVLAFEDDGRRKAGGLATTTFTPPFGRNERALGLKQVHSCLLSEVDKFLYYKLSPRLLYSMSGTGTLLYLCSLTYDKWTN